MILALALLATFLLGAAMSAQPAQAAGPFTVNTPNDEHLTTTGGTTCVSASGCSLRAAVEAANNAGGASTISVPPNTYTLTLGELQVGSYPIAGIASYNIAIQGMGTASNTIVQQTDGKNRVFNLDPKTLGNVTVSIQNLTITGGHDAADHFGGAGIISGNPSPPDTTTLSNCVLTNNHTTSPTATNAPGGGIVNSGGNLTINACTISNNSSGSSPGGGVDFEGISASAVNLTITNSTFSGNTLTNVDANAYITGGGLHFNASSVSSVGISGTTFSNNTVSGAGTGPVGGGAIGAEAPVTITSSTFTGNSANGPADATNHFAGGGAISVRTGTATIRYSRITGNSASNGPSGVLNNSNAASTIATNNWWGCNGGPGAAGCDTVLNAMPPGTDTGTLSVSPWLILCLAAAPNTISVNQTSALTADLNHDSVAKCPGATVAGHLPDGTPVSFAGTLGTVSPTNAGTSGGAAGSTYTAGGNGGNGSASATVDKQTVTTPITVQQPPAVTTQPAAQTVCAGSSATFTAAASGVPAPTVQWQVSTDGGSTFSNIAGATSTTLTLSATAADNGNLYRAVFSNGAGSPATSNAATLTVNTAPAVTTNPSNQSANVGGSATFTAAASGSPSPTVQWQVSSDGGSTFTNLTGATTTTLTLTNVSAGQNGNQYRAVFSNGCASATSTAATLTVNSPPVTTGQPVDQTVNAGTTATFTAAASGNPTPTVQWQVSSDGGSTFTNIGGATAPTLTFTATATDNGNRYRAVFTNSAGTATSNAATLTVTTAPVVTTQPAAQTVCAGSNVNFTAAAGGSPTPTVQWQVSTDGGTTFTNLAGATSTTLTFSTTAADNGNQYRAVFTNSAGSATSNAATLTVTTAPAITTQPADQTVTAGNTATFTAAASGSPAPTVQWQVSTDGGVTFTNLAGATSPTLSFTTASSDNGKRYRAVFTNACGNATSNAAALTVTARPTITLSPTTLPVGTQDSAYSQTITASGGSAPYRFTVSAGNLPAGLSLATNGLLSGTPTAAGSFPFTVTATDSANFSGSQAYTLVINGATTSTSSTSTATTSVSSSSSTSTTTSSTTTSVASSTSTTTASTTASTSTGTPPGPPPDSPRGWIYGHIYLAGTQTPVPGGQVKVHDTPLESGPLTMGVYQFPGVSITNGIGGGPTYLVVVIPPAGYNVVGSDRQNVTVTAAQGVLADFFVQPAGAGPTAPPSGPCRFILGFRTLHDLIPDIVGACLDNEGHNPLNGDGLQHTAHGLLVWRKSDNFSAFTDGFRTWVNGPYGVQERLNTQRFPWENNTGGLPLAAAVLREQRR